MKEKNKSNGMKRSQFIIGIILAIIGVVLLFSGIRQVISAENTKKENIKTTATVTNSDSVNKYTAVSFYVDSEEYNAVIKKYNANIKTGDEITIYYNKNNPSTVLLDDNNTGAGVYFGIGIVLLAIGLSIVLHKLNNSVNKETIQKTGKRIEADLEEIVYNTKVTANGVHPYYIKCTWKNRMNGKIYKFKSENLWYNPNEQFKKSGIEKIPVYIIPSNPNQYYVDVESINHEI